MSLIEGIGDEVIQFFLLVFAAVIAYVAWWSTNIREQRQYRTVLRLVDRRRHPNRSVLTAQYHTLLEGSTNNSPSIGTRQLRNSMVVIETVPQATVRPITVVEPTPNSSIPENLLPAEAVDEQNETAGDLAEINPEIIDLEGSEIIETMDADTQNELRQRRLAHFSTDNQSNRSLSDNQQTSETSTENCPEPIPTTSNVDSSGGDKSHTINSTSQAESTSFEAQNEISDNINVKLKFINDDIRLVDGNLKEALGDFRRRHFVEEVNANKDVKFIFKGQVLKQDQHTLESCGLFDNCVVHCLIHQKTRAPRNRNRLQGNANENNSQFFGNHFPNIINANNNNQGIDWDLGNFLFAVVSFMLLTAWYFRYVYAHLYTITATVGLIIVTAVFSIILVGAHLPNDDYNTRDANVRIRVTSTERIEVQQQ